MTIKKIGEQRYRGEIGRYFEDFEVGDVYEHRPGRTLTDADNIHFSLLTMNYHPMHCDAAFAEKSEFGKLLINSGLTLAIVLGMTVPEVSGKAIANLGWKVSGNRAAFLPTSSAGGDRIEADWPRSVASTALG
ncbi:MAG: itaconyl-CoA hydratase, partial [Thauera sp.]